MKKILLFPIFLSTFLFVNGQNKVKFTYDQSGNRIEKSIEMTKSAVTTKQEVITDVIKETKIKIYPNPMKGQLMIEIPESNDIKSCTITINAMSSGKLVVKKKATLPLKDIDISNQHDGHKY